MQGRCYTLFYIRETNLMQIHNIKFNPIKFNLASEREYSEEQTKSTNPNACYLFDPAFSGKSTTRGIDFLLTTCRYVEV